MHYAVEAIIHFEGPSGALFFVSSLLLVMMATCIFVSTRLMKEQFQVKWYDVALIVGGILLTYIGLRAHMAGGTFDESLAPCRCTCGWKWGWRRFCSMRRLSITDMLFAGIP